MKSYLAASARSYLGGSLSGGQLPHKLIIRQTCRQVSQALVERQQDHLYVSPPRNRNCPANFVGR
jgi:hypothetical protein